MTVRANLGLENSEFLHRAEMGRSSAAPLRGFASFARFGESTLWQGCAETRMWGEDHGISAD
jgi:hypothetical protein